MKGKKENNIGSNFFKEMNYEIAGEHGVINNEEMKKNKKLEDKAKLNKTKSQKK